MSPTDRDRFAWRASSRLWPDAAELDFARPDPLPPSRSLFLPDAPAADCLRRVFAAVEAGREFCVAPAAGLAPPTAAPVAPTDAHGLFQSATSGSSGASKRIRRTHRSWIESFETNRDALSITPDDVFATLGALSASLSLYGALEALHLGADLAPLADLRPRAQLAALAAARATLIYAAPTQIRLLHRALEAGGAPVTSVRKALLGGGALDPAARRKAKRLFPAAEIHCFYGAAETSFIALSDETCPPDSVGRPYPQVDLRLLDPEGRPAAPGAMGEIWVRSPYLSLGYAAGSSPLTRWRDGFVSVGDLGALDPAGHLRLLGRKDRMFATADHNVYPEAIEAVLREDDAVDDVLVAPEPDPERGAVPIAFVLGAIDAARADRLIARTREAFGPTLALRRVLVVADWPLLPSGKVDRAALDRCARPAR